jgi:UDP-glucose 4-epimerase
MGLPFVEVSGSEALRYFVVSQRRVPMTDGTNSTQKVILVTGVSNYWGAQVASHLLSDAPAPDTMPGLGYRVIGLDSQPPEEEIKGLDFVQADVRNPVMVDLLKFEQVHTVCHLAFTESTRASEATFDYNVMGTMKLLGACAEAGVHKVVLRSSTSVYGANSTNPSYITEKHPLQAGQTYASTRHWMEIEAFCNGFRRQVPEMILTILRFANILGPRSDTPMTRFLKEPLAPVLLGFDPLMQVIHEKDVVEALIYATYHDAPGVFNVAAEGILPLSRLTALASKVAIPVFHLFAYWGVDLAGSLGVPTGRAWPIEPDYLRYPCVGDLAKMHEQLGFVPRYTAEEALREFAGEQRLQRYMPGAAALAYDEERLKDTIERRRRSRELNTDRASRAVGAEAAEAEAVGAQEFIPEEEPETSQEVQND